MRQAARDSHRSARRTTSFVMALATAVLSVIGLALVANPAQARTTISSVGAALRTDPVYNDPAAERALTEAQASELRTQIEAAGTPIYIAVLPQAALDAGGGTPSALLNAIREATGEPGTYAVVVGENIFYAGSTLGKVGDIATDAYRLWPDVPAVLSTFVTGVSERAASGSSGSGQSQSSGGGIGWLLGLFGIGAAGVVGMGWYQRRKRAKLLAEQTERVRKVLDEDILAYGEALASLELDPNDPRMDEAAQKDYKSALDLYDTAQSESRHMQSPDDAKHVTESLEAGRWHIECVRARMNGQPVPERRDPCFFDPRHGLSVENVEWTPAGGAEREVPACAACATRIHDGVDPDYRQVDVNGQNRPYWEAGSQYGPWASGYYRQNGDLFSTILIGTMLGNAMSAPYGYGHGYGGAGEGSGGDWGGGGGWGDSGGGGGGGFFDGGGGGFDGGGGGW